MPSAFGRSVSVVVIAYNEALRIQDCLTSILNQDIDVITEIICVDDGSTDGTCDVVANVAATAGRVRCLTLPANVGRGSARAHGVAASRGDYVAMVDADVQLPAHWLRACLEALQGRDFDAVGGLAVPDGDVAWVYSAFGFAPKVVAATTTVSGSNGLYRRRLFTRVRFDPMLRNGEDVAFNHALVDAGFKAATVSGLTVTHSESKTYWDSVRWLFESGQGASRQLVLFKQVRTADLATFAFWFVAGASCVLSAKRLRWGATPGAYCLACSAVHLHLRFDLRPEPFGAVRAVIAHSTLLLSYFAGRTAGLGSRRRRAGRSVQPRLV
jgi:glycosyltransferase involved in cell wall biosynthesis